MSELYRAAHEETHKICVNNFKVKNKNTIYRYFLYICNVILS